MNSSSVTLKNKNSLRFGIRQLKKRTIYEEFQNSNGRDQITSVAGQGGVVANPNSNNKHLKYTNPYLTSEANSQQQKKGSFTVGLRKSLKSNTTTISPNKEKELQFINCSIGVGVRSKGSDENIAHVTSNGKSIPTYQELKIQILNYQNEVKKLKKDIHEMENVIKEKDIRIFKLETDLAKFSNYTNAHIFQNEKFIFEESKEKERHSFISNLKESEICLDMNRYNDDKVSEICKSIFDNFSQLGGKIVDSRAKKALSEENEDIIDYSINCYNINERRGDESIIHYQVNCLNEEESKEADDKENENDDDVIQFSNFNDTINQQKEANVDYNIENEFDDDGDEDGKNYEIEQEKDEIIEYNSQLGQVIEISPQLPNYNEDSDLSSECYEELENSHIYNSDVLSIVDNHNNNFDSVDPDAMTYEQLLELQDKIGYVNRGFTESILNKIPEESFSLGFSIDKCVICQYEFNVKDKVKKLSCNHAFHAKCAHEWLKKEKKCPVCNTEVKI